MKNLFMMLLMAMTAYLCVMGMRAAFHDAARWSTATRTWQLGNQLLFWLGLLLAALLALAAVVYHLIYAACWLAVMITGIPIG